MKKLLVVSLAAWACTAWAVIPTNLFTEALIKGEAELPAPTFPPFGKAIEQIKKATGSSAPVMLHVQRIKRFEQQPNCGRIVFFLYQGKSAWKNLGGQLNICKDGFPPKQICEAKPDKLVNAGTKCPDGRPSVDTKEVSDAIAAAVASGSLTPEQVKEKAKKNAR